MHIHIDATLASNGLSWQFGIKWLNRTERQIGLKYFYSRATEGFILFSGFVLIWDGKWGKDLSSADVTNLFCMLAASKSFNLLLASYNVVDAVDC